MESTRSTATPHEPTADAPPYAIVVIGASAGGLRALETVLEALPPEFPVPIVIVQHLDRRHRSLMADILSRHTVLPVGPAVHHAALRPGTITIAIPDHHLLIEPGNRVALTQTELVRFVRPSIDLLFESAAGTLRDRTIGVVLTGTGSDGAAGAQTIHQVGGTVIAEDPTTADFPGMPQAAIDTGAVDVVLRLDEIAPALVDLVVPEASR